jgi:hypothetical protein
VSTVPNRGRIICTGGRLYESNFDGTSFGIEVKSKLSALVGTGSCEAARFGEADLTMLSRANGLPPAPACKILSGACCSEGCEDVGSGKSVPQTLASCTGHDLTEPLRRC